MIDCSTLNPAQLEAVQTTEGPLLVLAGAGSGKTRVLTYRIAHLVEDLGVAPYNILAVTFTNKAASEMRERLGTLLQGQTRGMWISTFHSLCVRILRADAELLGFTSNFSIYDADDAKRLVKDVMATLGYDPKRYSEQAVRSKISALKNDLVSPESYKARANDPFSKCTARVYAAYQERLKRANAFDFDDLLYCAHELLSTCPQVAAHYAQRFCYILVDEYQDTNKAQYAICRLLSSVHRNLMVVGDDDQSIYSWRGADIRNILEFERDWPDAHTVKLEQNYRSTGNILNAANAVIANNQGRKAKRLVTTNPDGERIAVYLAAEEHDEGRWIASRIEQLHDSGSSYDDIAVFYRTNAQSRSLEDMLLRAGVPYRIVGGTRFFDRAEIRDVTAYLKIVDNPADDMSVARVVNTPRRGIGKTTMQRIEQSAAQRSITLLEALREEALDPSCRAATRKALSSFAELIDELSSFSGNLVDVVKAIVDRTGLIAALQAQRTDEADGRIENIQEFIGVVAEYEHDHPVIVTTGPDGAESEHDPQLADFMEWLSLRTDLDTLGQDSDEHVTLMTVHSAKGLEFDTVFVAGLEEGIFPHMNSVMEHGVEEERRLAYVAITRARKRLFLTHAQTRHLFGNLQANARSRFISEIGSECIEHVGLGSMGLTGTGWEKRGDRRGISGSGRGQEVYGGRVFGSGGHVDAHKVNEGATQLDHKQTAAEADFAEGDKVEHKTFGPGVVVAVDGDKLSIRFARSGQTKKLLKGYAPIVKVSS